jgi:hypothetical protein
MKNLKIIKDWERESLKDFIYLYEEERLLDAQIKEELKKRQPAQITVVSKIPKKEHEYNPLPF